MLGIPAICWALWKTRNQVCFEGKAIRHPVSIVCYACALMSYWAGLFEGEDRKALEDGVDTMLQIALRPVDKMVPGNNQLLLQQEEDDDQHH